MAAELPGRRFIGEILAERKARLHVRWAGKLPADMDADLVWEALNVMGGMWGEIHANVSFIARSFKIMCVAGPSVAALVAGLRAFGVL